MSDIADIHQQFSNFSFGFGGPAQPEAAGHAAGASPQVEHSLRAALPPRKSSADIRPGGPAHAGAAILHGRLKLIVLKVKAELNRPLTPDEQAVVDGGFMLARHVRAVSAAMKVMNAGCSFCHTGEWSLKRIEMGAEAKGHDTIEKTLKPTSIRAAFRETAEQVLLDAKNADILGYVAKLNSKDRSGRLIMGREVAGFALSEDPHERALGAVLERGTKGEWLYPVDFTDSASLDASLATLKAVVYWHRLVLTGDYDMHCLISLTGQPHTVPSNSSDEWGLMDAVNAGISASDSEFRPRDEPHMNLVKHGPQVNYVAYTKAEEPGTRLIRAVAEPRFPLAMCIADKGWMIVPDLKTLRDIYGRYGIVMKESWAQGGSLSFEGPDDNVALTRRSSAATTGSGSTSRRTSLANIHSTSRRASLANTHSTPRRTSLANVLGTSRRTSHANTSGES
ncbi:hypothetical protein [Burkholderia cepacia]|uniref:hypothetical protein n=1 Tax=Burkholderia cepacia TaxID=292 RepID=UPI00398E9EBE